MPLRGQSIMLHLILGNVVQVITQRGEYFKKQVCVTILFSIVNVIFCVSGGESTHRSMLPCASDIYFINPQKERVLLVVKVVKLYYVDIFQAVKTYGNFRTFKAVQNTT
jgi:hypothetical protein